MTRPRTDPPNQVTQASTGIDVRVAGALVAVLVVGVALLGLVVRVNGPLTIDVTLPPAVMAWYPPPATDLFDTIGTLPVFGGIVVVLGLVGFLVLHRPGLAVACVVALCGEIPATAAKLIVDRPRPPASTEIEAFVTAASYPSGHTVRAVLIAGLVVAAIGWRHRSVVLRVVAVIVGVSFVAAVGLARIASGQHWPTDVLGGLMLGTAWLAVCLVVADWVDRRTAPRSEVPPT
ncbi:MAG TPA: phosphatase PAP2 family protein [Candidatus Limnocylindrales bacterium]|nr:phosphatase PAP2 family protein [Candidatus Limnocylindrales bacterium]